MQHLQLALGNIRELLSLQCLDDGKHAKQAPRGSKIGGCRTCSKVNVTDNPACHADPFVFRIGNISTSIVFDHLQAFFAIHHVLGKVNVQDTVTPFVGQEQVRLILAFITPSVPLVLLICCVGIEVCRRGSGMVSTQHEWMNA